MRQSDHPPAAKASRRIFLGGVASSGLLLSGATVQPRRIRVRLPVKPVRTVGSIAAGSNQLVVASAAGFSVGDSIIVELGGESSGGKPGSPGVGGVWPALSYPDEAAMRSDTSQPEQIYCYCRDTGLVYRWDAPGVGATWFNDPAEFYWRYAVPVALTAKVVGISGPTLTLDARAIVASTNAHVHFDNAPVFNAAARTASDNTVLVWPEGRFACGAILEVSKRTGVMITGAGQERTSLFSPKGVICVGIEVIDSPRTEVCHLTLAGNAYLASGWGLDFRYTSQIAPPHWNYALDIVRSDNCDAHDISMTYPWLAAGAHYCEHGTFRRLRVATDGLQRYVSWMINWVNSTNCWSYDCEVTSKYLTAGFECFASNHCGHTRPTGVNAVFSLNSTGGCVLVRPSVRITAMAQLSALSFSNHNPIINVNTNIPQNKNVSENSIIDASLVQEGYINTDNDILRGIDVNGASFGTIISGGTYSAPDYAPPSTLGGPQAIVANDGRSRDTSVSNFTATGLTSDKYHPNIDVVSGSVANCQAPLIVCSGATCQASANTTPQEDPRRLRSS